MGNGVRIILRRNLVDTRADAFSMAEQVAKQREVDFELRDLLRSSYASEDAERLLVAVERKGEQPVEVAATLEVAHCIDHRIGSGLADGVAAPADALDAHGPDLALVSVLHVAQRLDRSADRIAGAYDLRYNALVTLAGHLDGLLRVCAPLAGRCEFVCCNRIERRAQVLRDVAERGRSIAKGWACLFMGRETYTGAEHPPVLGDS
jgi:hypothetical protein